ncbi:MAG: flavin-containing monooxygenase [Bacillus sp. (in: firmicutes)]
MADTQFDAVIIGAGFSGLYMLYRLREAGLSVNVFEAADGVGGTWYWNRYPGASCDVESIYYCYSFSEELLQEWNWSTRYPKQAEILSYLNYVTDKFDLRRDIQFNTRVKSASFEEEKNKWLITLEDDTTVYATYFITGVGCLSAANVPAIKGLASFGGEWYHTGNWPHEKVDFSNKRVGVIGTGSSGVQAIPVIAEEAGYLTVFQRTPQYSVPARNYSYGADFIQKVKENYREIKDNLRHTQYGFPNMPNGKSALEDPPEERKRVFEEAWQRGGFDKIFASTYIDLSVNPEANKTAADFIRGKIKEVVSDPELAEKLSPAHYYATKRPIQDTGYFETFNRENVLLVDVKAEPIIEITPNGLLTTKAEYELDVIVFATGFDAMTGPLLKIDIRGRNGVSLKEKWGDGAGTRTYLGVANAGFPNMFMITGPESPSVISNMAVSIEQHVEWIADCIEYLRNQEIDTIEAQVDAEHAWSAHCKEVADSTLLVQTDSWYMGANIEGKPRSFPIYLGGVGTYRQICDDIAAKGYEGFLLKNKR